MLLLAAVDGKKPCQFYCVNLFTNKIFMCNHVLSKVVFPNLLEFAMHLTIKLVEKPTYLGPNFIFYISCRKFLFFRGALVDPVAVVGNHCSTR